jgi:hypothetical protein
LAEIPYAFEVLHALRRRAIEALIRTPARHVVGPAYAAVVTAELAAVRRTDARGSPPFGRLDDVTALVKTFERPMVCARLLESVRRCLPGLRVVVVDDSCEPRSWPGAVTIHPPYDVGAAEGRNIGLRAIDTELFLLLDDDFVVFNDTDVRRVAAYMRANPTVDLVGGQVIDLPFFTENVTPWNRDCLGGSPRTVGGLPVYDRVAQFWVARTRRIMEHGWNPRLKLVEHTEFFVRARNKLLTVFDASFRVLHAKTPFDVAYMKKRLDTAQYEAILAELDVRAGPYANGVASAPVPGTRRRRSVGSRCGRRGATATRPRGRLPTQRG